MIKYFFIFLFCPLVCFGQYPIKSDKDNPLFTGAKELIIRYAKPLLDKYLISPVDTVANEWEKYAMYYIKEEVQGFCATESPYIFMNTNYACYKDTLLYPEPFKHNLGRHLFEAALKGDITCMSYDGQYKLSKDQVLNVLRQTEDDQLIDEFTVVRPDTTFILKLNRFDLIEFDSYFVIEKTVRTRQFQISSKILAICPVGYQYDGNGIYIGIKMCNWFILP